MIKINNIDLNIIIVVLLIIVVTIYFYNNIIDYFGNTEIDLSLYEKKIFSQHGEDGVTEKIIELLYDNNDNKYYVEFGVENGMECNTRVLREIHNWKGLMMDGSNQNDTINLQKEFITKENIISLFRKYNVPKKINYLCIDIDYNDFYCLKEILKEYICDIIVLEYNATHFADEDKIVMYGHDKMWDGTNYFGGSLLAFYKLCNKYNYSLVYCDNSGTNAFFIHNNLIKSLNFINFNNIDKLYKSPNYGYINGPRGGHPADPENRKYITFEEAINI